MYLRIETRPKGHPAKAYSLEVVSISECGSGRVQIALNQGEDTLYLWLGGDLPNGVIGSFSGGEPVTQIDMMESLDDEVRSIMLNYFQTEEQPQPTPELPLPPMMGFDDEQ